MGVGITDIVDWAIGLGSIGAAMVAAHAAHTANKVAKLALDVGRDQTVYYWEVWYNPDKQSAVLRNQGPRTAYDVTADLTLCGEIMSRQQAKSLASSKSIEFKGMDRLCMALENGQFHGGDGWPYPVDWNTPVEIRVEYATELGIRRSVVVEKPLGKFQ